MRFLGLIALAALLAGCGGGDKTAPTDTFGDGWSGQAVCYGPHRDGQRPGAAAPSVAELREDLDLMLPHWNLLRIYGATGFAESLLQIIRDEGLEMAVVLGVWIAPDDPEGNRAEVAAGIRLANAYPGVVVAVCVGNETQVDWSAHRSPLADVIGHVRKVRAGVAVPVTSADDFNFWNKPESRALAAELDVITLHAHPLWNGLQVDGALTWLQEQLAEVQALHPGSRIVIGETGWATTAHDQGEQAELIKGKPGEAEQQVFYGQVRRWAADSGTTVFFFEAFDENWKGGDHPDEVEKHWGVFRADRTPKRAVAGR